MELSRPFADRPAPARFTGLAVVIAVHVVAIAALSLGFMKPAATPPGPILLRPLPDTPHPPPQPEPLRPTRPDFAAVPINPVQPLPWEAEHAPLAAATPSPVAPTLASGGSNAAARAEPAAATGTATPAALPGTAGTVCAVMPRPEPPMLGWSGEAVLQVLATVRGGRVVASEFRMLQGAPDPKSRRALQRAVETALAGYRCQGDASFQQDFAFRLD